MASVPGENRCAKAEAFCETWDKGCTAFVAKQWECCTELGTEFLPNRHGTQRCFDNLGQRVSLKTMAFFICVVNHRKDVNEMVVKRTQEASV